MARLMTRRWISEVPSKIVEPISVVQLVLLVAIGIAEQGFPSDPFAWLGPVRAVAGMSGDAGTQS